MRQFHPSLLLLLLAVPATHAQKECQFGSDDAAGNLIKALNAQQSCKAAADLLDKCMWGSSADTEFAPIVVEKCEKEFISKLSATGRNNYMTEMQLCAYEFARGEGTLTMSEAAVCQAEVSAQFAANPSQNDHPPARASFDCARAQTPLEKAICSHIQLGHADIALSRAFKPALNVSRGPHRAALVESERKWLAGVPVTCGLAAGPASPATLSCIRFEFELRFTALDDCDAAGDEGDGVAACVDNPDTSSEAEPNSTSGPSERASFDCEAPKTALEIVICADADLGQKDIELAQAYRDAGAQMGVAQHDALVENERKWLKFATSSCPLGVVGGIPPIMTRACVRSAFEMRIGQLKSCPQKPVAEQLACLSDFQIMTQ